MRSNAQGYRARAEGHAENQHTCAALHHPEQCPVHRRREPRGGGLPVHVPAQDTDHCHPGGRCARAHRQAAPVVCAAAFDERDGHGAGPAQAAGGSRRRGHGWLGVPRHRRDGRGVPLLLLRLGLPREDPRRVQAVDLGALPPGPAWAPLSRGPGAQPLGLAVARLRAPA